MSDLKARCLEAFPEWLKSLGPDIASLADLLSDDELDEGTRRWVTGGINYLFKSLDLIPDGIEDLGFIDDAFVVRVAASKALAGCPDNESLKRLAADAQLIEAFLEEDFSRLETYVGGLSQVAARGRTVDEVVADAGLREQLVGEARAWAEGYDAPTFARDEKNLVKLRAFLATKLPS
ncbi:MAG: DUF1232 domain-containing protein [Polyangiaceae bacterium]|nr:DUF1232 domain-containing protein [Polyangiaceae bacterium]